MSNNLERLRAESVMRKYGWLAGRPRAFQDLVLARCELLTVKATRAVYKSGDAAGGLFGLIEGALGVHLATAGSVSTLAFMGAPGFWVGDAAAIRGHPRLVTIRAASDCQVFRLRRAELMLLGAQEPMTWMHVAVMTAQNIERLVNLIHVLKRSDPEARVAALLVMLVDELRQQKPVISATQTDLAAMAAMGRGSVNAALRTLEARKLIRRQYRSVEVLNSAALRQFARRVIRTPRDAATRWEVA